MNETMTLLQNLAVWAELHPLALVGATLLLPLLLIGIVEAIGGGWQADVEPEEPPVTAPAEPVLETDVEPEAAVQPVAPPAPLDVAAEPQAAVAEPESPQLELELTSEPAVAPAPELVPESELAAEPEPEPALEPVRLSDRLRRTREGLVGRLGQILGGRQVDADVLDDLEAVLFGADLGVATAESLLEVVRARAQGGDADAVQSVLREEIHARLSKVEIPNAMDIVAAPHVILVLGVNGAGKTTTIGKLAARHTAAGRKVVLGAGDTFRAAAREQLQVWGERAGCEVIVGPDGGDPSAVAFDTVKAATARGADVAIIDTAGRLQTKKPLMEELGKMVRVIGKDLPGAPHETLLVLDANTGQNAISQAELFTEVAGVTGLVLTKLDGTAKGGVIVGLADKFGIPVKFVGVGERVEDLRDFQATEFVNALFGD